MGCTALASCQATTVEFAEPPEQKSIGQLVHAIALSNAAHSEVCSEERQDSLRFTRDSLVSAVDETLSPGVLSDLPGLMRTSVLPALDEGHLERLVRASADALATLVDDELDPQRKGLAAVSKLLDSTRLLQDQHLLELARVLILDPSFAPAVHALASLGSLADPLRSDVTLLHSLLSSISAGLETTQGASSLCTGLDVSAASKRLIDTSGFASSPVPGGAAWVAEVDFEGNAIALDASQLASAPFGFGANYDAQGRRLSAGGSLAYRYFDARHTALAHLLRLAGEATDAGVAFDLI